MLASLVVASLTSMALAAPRTVPAPPASPTTTVRTQGDSWNSVPIYMQTRGALAVPNAANGDVAVAGVALGILVDDAQQNAVGLRFSCMDDPPESPFASDTPALPHAWGPVVDWTYIAQPQRRASFFFSGSAGYVYGTPEDESYDNVILPILEGGVGLRFSKRLADGKVVYLAPELGFVPGAVAPLTALNIGMILPGKNG